MLTRPSTRSTLTAVLALHASTAPRRERIRLPGGGLVTEKYESKPVCDRLKKLIHEEWNTRLDGTTGRDGQFAFRGFRGKYTVAVTVGENEQQSFQAVLEKGPENVWTFTAK